MKLPFNHIIMAVVLLLFCAFVACTRVPDDVLDKEQMAALLVDIHTGEAVVESNLSKYSNDSSKRVVKQSIYAHHGLTTQQAENSFRWYGNHMDKYIEVYDRVLDIINEKMEDAQQRAGVEGVNVTSNNRFLAFEGDSVDVWNDVRFRPFAANLSSQHLTFILKSDSNWERGDVYTFRYKLAGNSRSATINVAVDYNDGSKEYYSKSAIGEGWHDAAFALDSARNAREIYGSISYSVVNDERACIDSISLTRTRWGQWRKPLRKSMNNLSEKWRSRKFD